MSDEYQKQIEELAQGMQDLREDVNKLLELTPEIEKNRKRTFSQKSRLSQVATGFDTSVQGINNELTKLHKKQEALGQDLLIQHGKEMGRREAEKTGQHQIAQIIDVHKQSNSTVQRALKVVAAAIAVLATIAGAVKLYIELQGTP